MLARFTKNKKRKARKRRYQTQRCECLQTKALRTARSIKTDGSDALLESSPTRHFATHLVEMALRAGEAGDAAPGGRGQSAKGSPTRCLADQRLASSPAGGGGRRHRVALPRREGES